MTTQLEQEYREWRQTPQAAVVLECYSRVAQGAADRGCTVDMKQLALGAVQWELAGSTAAQLGAPKSKVYDDFLELIRLDMLRERPELEPFVRPPVRRPGGRNARHSGATR